MCASVRACVCLCVYAHVCVHVYVHVCARVRMCVCVVYVCVYACTCVRARVECISFYEIRSPNTRLSRVSPIFIEPLTHSGPSVCPSPLAPPMLHDRDDVS